uniref:Uncharacterized protein n=1 Tax=Mycena chlorophos TaxID=658473 RepID=A0ABQ0L0C7_MYCCL|nr:predicted protein [Mycena chlorophos]
MDVLLDIAVHTPGGYNDLGSRLPTASISAITLPDLPRIDLVVPVQRATSNATVTVPRVSCAYAAVEQLVGSVEEQGGRGSLREYDALISLSVAVCNGVRRYLQEIAGITAFSGQRCVTERDGS